MDKSKLELRDKDIKIKGIISGNKFELIRKERKDSTKDWKYEYSNNIDIERKGDKL